MLNEHYRNPTFKISLNEKMGTRKRTRYGESISIETKKLENLCSLRGLVLKNRVP